MPARSFTVELERVQKTTTMFRVPFDLETVAVPRDLATALAADPVAKKAFAAMSFTHEGRVRDGKPQR